MNWALLLNIFKILKHAKSLINLCKQHKGKALLVISILIIFTTTFIQLISFHKDSMAYFVTKDNDKLIKHIDNFLKRCGDKTAISISSVNIFSSEDGIWQGRFRLARACDVREKNNNCILDLKDRKPALYSSDHPIRLNSYRFLVGLGNSSLSSRFDLRKDGKQDLSSLNDYSSITYIIKELDWYSEAMLYNIWITSIINRHEDLLYIITFLSAKSLSESTCFDQDVILNNIKNFIINN